jgi:hypothetical protein
MTDFSAVTARVRALQEQLRTEGYDDEDVIASIESETDLFRVFDRVAEKIDQDNRSAVIARARAKRLETRADRNTEFLDFLMRTIGNQTKIERPTATVFYRDNPVALAVEGEVPEEFTVSVPDKARIKQALIKGEKVPNCRLTKGRSLLVKAT